MFYLFTDNAEPLQSRVGYTHFDILMLLKFDGDKIATIKYLEKKYNIIHYKSVVTKKTIDFPLNVFPEKIQSYIKEQNTIGNFDINLMSSTFLWLIGTLIGNRLTTYVSDTWNVSPVMWLMIIAERGSTKTHAINAIIKPAKKFDKLNRAEFEKELEHYNPDDKSAKRPVWNQLFLEDGTREGFVKAMNNNKGGLGLMKDELTGWVADMDKHNSGKGGDESFWLSSFNNSDYSKTIKSDDGSYVDRMFISLGGSIQPALVNELVKKHTANGLFDRFLLVPYKEKQFKFSLQKKQSDYHLFYTEFINLFYNIMQPFSPDGTPFYFEHGAELDFENIYNKFLNLKFKDPNPSIRAYISKIITYLPRICLVVEMITQIYNINIQGDIDVINPQIKKDSVLKTEDILLYFINNARNVLSDIDVKTDWNDIIKAAGAITKPDKIMAILNYEPDAVKSEIADFMNTSKQRVQYYFNKNKESKNSKNVIV
jgi:hypothetical protein